MIIPLQHSGLFKHCLMSLSLTHLLKLRTVPSYKVIIEKLCKSTRVSVQYFFWCEATETFIFKKAKPFNGQYLSIWFDSFHKYNSQKLSSLSKACKIRRNYVAMSNHITRLNWSKFVKITSCYHIFYCT